MEKTYVGWKELGYTRNQVEYTEPTPILDEKGDVLVKGGWARHNVFEYDRTLAHPQWRGKEWDFYQICNGKYMVQISFANISIGGYASAVLVDVSGEETKLISTMSPFLGGKNKYVLPANGEKENAFTYTNGDFLFREVTGTKIRTVEFKGVYKKQPIEAMFKMEIFDDHESCVTVTPFKRKGKYLHDRFFLTMKQNSMPTEGYFRVGNETFTFTKADTFTVLDWGRGVWPYKEVWYWGNGSSYITDEEGKKHVFGFEVTWGIGNEDNGTATCLFLDGKAHKIGSVDVEVFPKPDKYMEPWHFVSEDGRFDMTMTPVFDHHSDLNIGVARMHSHQVHGRWNGTVILDDGKKLTITDMYAFCEYVENHW